jgi:hypothetical protein
MTELEILYPTGIDVTLHGEVFNIRPFKLGHITLVLKTVQQIIDPIKKAQITGNVNDPMVIMAILAETGDDLINLLSKILDRPVEFVNDLEQDESVKLISALIEVNKDFFSKRVQPILKKPVLKKKEVGQTL